MGWPIGTPEQICPSINHYGRLQGDPVSRSCWERFWNSQDVSTLYSYYGNMYHSYDNMS